MSSGEISICNIALGYLGAGRISSFSDDTVESILCNDNYAELRDAVLEEGRWAFATRRIKPGLLVAAPEYGYSRKFQIPSDILNVIEATDDTNFVNGPSTLDWRREEQFIMADVDVIWAKCIVRITDTAKMTPMFRQALATRIAAELAPTLTEGNTKTDQMWRLYEAKVSNARTIDNMQGRNDRARGRSLTTFVR